MKCPFCADTENKVIDSRLSKEGYVIRRRRECLACNRRFTTYERIEEIPLMIIKKDGRREEFNRDKIRIGITKACEKRNVSMNSIEDFLDELEQELRETGKKEISSSVVGERVINRLHDLDEIAYVRFASVYREFKDVNEFVQELKLMLENNRP
ncbi:MAG: transcriptional regulator NrdR [Deltaproteobacteria bacterium]|nr:transcriptional regulator NrdR [Deltaproteobacteria bacterium]